MLEQNVSSTRHGGIEGAEVYLHSFATSTIDEGESSVSCPGRFTAEERPPLHTLNRRLDGPQNLSACCEENEYLLPLPEMGEKWIFFQNLLGKLYKTEWWYT